MIRTHTFSGQRYRVEDSHHAPKGLLGQCDNDARVVHIPIEGDTVADLDVVIHEGLHACCPYLDEYAVDEAATSLAKLLWRLGWRRE